MIHPALAKRRVAIWHGVARATMQLDDCRKLLIGHRGHTKPRLHWRSIRGSERDRAPRLRRQYFIRPKRYPYPFARLGVKDDRLRWLSGAFPAGVDAPLRPKEDVARLHA